MKSNESKEMNEFRHNIQRKVKIERAHQENMIFSRCQVKQGVKQGAFEENSFENKMPQSFWKTFQMNLKDCKEIKDKHKNWEWHIWSWAGSDQTTSNFQKYSMNTFEKKFFILFSARASIYETKTQKSKLRHHLFFFKFLINSEIFLISPHFENIFVKIFFYSPHFQKTSP